MEVIAKHRNAGFSAQKVRLLADQIRKLPVSKALDILTFSSKKAAVAVKKVLLSAVFNAEHNKGLDIDELIVERVYVDEASRLKRWHARAKGRGNRILKRSCHVNIVVANGGEV
jgi:large subunit ribosomal protein L22